MDFFIGFISGFALCSCIVIVVALIRQQIYQEPDGVDDVLDELFQTVQNQPKPYHDEERQEDFKSKFPQED